MKKYKQFLIGFLVGAILFSSIPVIAEGLTVLLNPFPIFFNGQQATVEAYNINGRTYLALGDVAKYFDATAVFNETNKRIDVNKNSKPVTVTAPAAQPTEETIATSDFYVLEVNVSEVWVRDSNNKVHGVLPISMKSTAFTANTTIKGYFKDGYLFLQNTEGKFIHSYMDAIPPDRTYKGSN